ncbi:MAG: 30S ribosomal protein S8 [Acidobacteriota bacterium]
MKPTTDPIADMLTRIRNAAMVNQSELSLPHSKLKAQLAKILQQYGFIAASQTTRTKPPQLELVLRREGSPSRLTNLQRVSKPGRRVYVKAGAIPTIRGGRGLTVVSTSAGLLPGHVAKQRGLGGELICKVW